MSFADFERELRDEMYTPTPLYDNPQVQAKIEAAARQRVGRIGTAGSDAGWDAYTHIAIDQSHRAVSELLSQGGLSGLSCARRACKTVRLAMATSAERIMSTFNLLRVLASLAAVTWCGLSQAQQTPPPPNPAWKITEVVAFIGVKQGDSVADIIAGRLTPALAQAVGPQGKVYAVETAEVVKAHPQALTLMQGLAEKMPNIVVSSAPVAAPLPTGLDAVFIRQNYHDLYNQFMGPADVVAFNKNVFSALKPGGVYVILDHAALAGSDLSATATLHRIDPARVKKDVLAAGFKLDEESKLLANVGDDHAKNVFDPSIRDHTDQFLYRFVKPK